MRPATRAAAPPLAVRPPATATWHRRGARRGFPCQVGGGSGITRGVPRPACGAVLADHRLRQLVAGTRRLPAPCRARAARGSRRAARPPSRVVAGLEHHPGLDHFALRRRRACRPRPPRHRRMRGEHLFDLARPHLEAARLDQVLLAIDDEDVAVLVEVAEIAGVQPACAPSVDAVAQRRRPSRPGCSSSRPSAAARG